MSTKDTRPTGHARFALRMGMLIGLVSFILCVVGLGLLQTLKSQLGSMSPNAPEGWISYDFMYAHISALSLTWVGLCVAVTVLSLAYRRKWRHLAGVLIVLVPALVVLLGFVLYAIGLSNGLRAATG